MEYVFLATCLVFATVAFVISRRGRRDSLAFRTTDPGLNVVGLVTANITAGTGFVYLLLNGAKNGLLACLLPLALLAGYRVMAHLLDGIPAHLLKPNFLQGVSNEIARTSGAKSALPQVLIIPLLVTFILVLGFEMFATSQLLSALIFEHPTTIQQGAIASALFVTTVAVVYRGGEATYKTDRIQAFLIALCVAALALLGAFAWIHYPDRHVGAFAMKTESTVIASLTFAAIAAFNTQIYSILNWNAVANTAPEKRCWVLLTSSNWLGGFVLIVLFIGASMPGVWGSGFQVGLSGLLRGIPSPIAVILLSILIIGTTAIVLTTTQGVTLAIGAFFSELVAEKSLTRSGGFGVGRLLHALILAAVMGVLGLIFYQRPDLFFFLLAIVSGAEVMMPLIILLMVLAKRGSALSTLSNGNIYFYLAMFVVTIATNLALSVSRPTFVPYASLCLVALSATYSIWLYRVAAPTPLGRDATS